MELMFGELLKLSGVVDVFGTKQRLSLRDPFQIYMYTRFVIPFDVDVCDLVPLRESMIKGIEGIQKRKVFSELPEDCRHMIHMLDYGIPQRNFIDIFMAYVIPVFENIAGFISCLKFYEFMLNAEEISTPKIKDHYLRDIICGVHFVDRGHYVSVMVLWKLKQVLYLDPLGKKETFSEGTKQGLSRIVKFICSARGEDSKEIGDFKICELDFPPNEFRQQSGEFSCMDWSCVMFYVFLKYFHGQITRGEPLHVPKLSEKLYNFREIAGNIFVTKEGLLSFQRGILNMVLKTMEFNEFLELEGVDKKKKTRIQEIMSLTDNAQGNRMRDRLSGHFKHIDSVWGYVLVGDCGIPREILGACAELKADGLNLENILNRFTNSKLAMLMIALHYKQKHEILLQLFNAIPDKVNTKTLANGACTITEFPLDEGS